MTGIPAASYEEAVAETAAVEAAANALIGQLRRDVNRLTGEANRERKRADKAEAKIGTFRRERDDAQRALLAARGEAPAITAEPAVGPPSLLRDTGDCWSALLRMHRLIGKTMTEEHFWSEAEHVVAIADGLLHPVVRDPRPWRARILERDPVALFSGVVLPLPQWTALRDRNLILDRLRSTLRSVWADRMSDADEPHDHGRIHWHLAWYEVPGSDVPAIEVVAALLDARVDP